MSLEKILAISGKPGLYVLKVQTRSGFVAESLLDGKKVTVGLRNNVSLLSEISIYTHSGEKALADVMQILAEKENNGPAMSHKEDKLKLESYFKEILPDYDEERVYASDIKKVLNWYNMLQSKGLIVAKETVKEEAKPADEKPKIEKPKAAKTGKTEKPVKEVKKKKKEE